MQTEGKELTAGASCWVDDLNGRVALITGGGGGIGTALVRAFSQAGTKVVAVDIDGAAARAACEGAPSPCLAICADVSDEAAVQRIIKETQGVFGSIDILVNCAAVALKGSVVSFPVEDWDTTMRVNLRGTFLMCRAVLPQMIERKYGRIINFSSIDARKGRLWGCAYSTSKFGIVGFTESLANEVTKHGITANAVLPAGVATPMWSISHPDKDPATVLAPEDLVDIVLFLASSGGRHISGASIDVFGKRLMTKTFQLG